MVSQHMILQAKDSQIRSRTPDGGIDLRGLRLRELSAKPVQRLGPPTGLGRDTAAQVGNAHGLALPEFAEEIG